MNLAHREFRTSADFLPQRRFVREKLFVRLGNQYKSIVFWSTSIVIISWLIIYYLNITPLSERNNVAVVLKYKAKINFSFNYENNLAPTNTTAGIGYWHIIIILFCIIFYVLINSAAAATRGYLFCGKLIAYNIIYT